MILKNKIQKTILLKMILTKEIIHLVINKKLKIHLLDKEIKVNYNKVF